MQLFHRVLLREKPTWMFSSTPFISPNSKLKLKKIQNAQEFEKEPISWLKQGIALENEEVDVHYSQLLAPLPSQPPAVYGLGLNYDAHSKETNMPLPQYPIVIGKSPTSLIGPNENILIPKVCPQQEVDFEVELAIIIGKTCKNASRGEALDYVLGFTCGNDVSARKWQGKKGGGQWTRAKSFDTFMPLGPSIASSQSIDCSKVNIRSRLQKAGQSMNIMQDSSTRDLIFDIPTLIEFLSQDTTLPAWSIILTGTPSGVGYTRNPPVLLEKGDIIQVEIDGVGVLTNPVQNG